MPHCHLTTEPIAVPCEDEDDFVIPAGVLVCMLTQEDLDDLEWDAELMARHGSGEPPVSPAP